MATWTPKNAMRGIAVSRWGRPPPPPHYVESSDYPSSETLPSTPPDSDLEGDQEEEESSPQSPFPLVNDIPCPNSPMEEPEVYDWLESQLATAGEMTVVERLQYLLDTGQFADVNVRVGTGNNVTVFKAHRLLLATASQPLYRLIYAANPSPGPTDVTTIRVTDMKATDFEHILKYIYTDSIDCNDINVAFELLRASKKWGLAGLGIKSLHYLEEFLDEFEPSSEDMKTNLFDLLVLSEQSLMDMYEKCLQVLVKYCNEVIPCEGFLNLEKPLIDKLINHSNLSFDNQLKLFEAIRDWGLRYIKVKNMKLSQLGDIVESLIKVVDFEKIEDNDFVATVLTSECLGKAEVIAFFMVRGLDIPRNLDFNNNKQLPFWIWFCATSDLDGIKKMKIDGDPGIPSLNQVSPPISLKNGNVSAFQKVCRFRKGYRCPQEEIYLPHELRFRSSKHIKLLGVGFGFLFSCTDMGVTIHCQGPWETRQWTDIVQTYCRVSGEKQETADVRLMFSEPVRIVANQSYKVMVKIGRMSSGSSEVELWGGTGAQYTISSEDIDFFFVKAAVDPETKVDEKDGDVNPGIITELLYQPDTDDHSNDEVKSTLMTRRRRQKSEDEGDSQQSSDDTSQWRKRHRAADMSLKIPEVTRIRRRGDGSDSIAYTPKKSPVEEYKPMSFSTNRWRTKKTGDESEATKTTVDEYLPSSFSTNRWRTTRTREEDKSPKVEEYTPSSFSTNRWRTTPQNNLSTSNTTAQAIEDNKPSSFSTNRWRTKPQDDSNTTATKSVEEYKPTGFSTNRWRTRSREEDSDAKSILNSSSGYSSRKTSAEENPDSSSSNRWRTKSREEIQPPKVELRKTIGVDDDKSLPFLRRRESTENKPPELSFMRRRESAENKVNEMPAYLRKRTATVEDNKTATPFGRSRFGTSSSAMGNTNTITSSTLSKPSDSISIRTRDSSASRISATRDTPSTTSLSSLSRPRDSSLTRNRESSISRFRDSSSMSRFGPSSTRSYGGSYMSRYDSSPKGEVGTNSSEASSRRYGSSALTGSSQRRYTGAGSDSALCRNRYGSSLTNGVSDYGTSNRYSSASNKGTSDLRCSSRYGSSTSMGLNGLGSSNRYGLSAATGLNNSTTTGKYGSTSVTKPGGYGSNSSSRQNTTDYSRINDTDSSGRRSRYSSPFNNRSTEYSKSHTSSRYGSPSRLSPAPSAYSSSSKKDYNSEGSNRYSNAISPTSRYSTTSTRYGKSPSRY